MFKIFALFVLLLKHLGDLYNGTTLDSDVTVEAVLDCGCVLGESPVWDHVTNTLLFVDKQFTSVLVHRYDPATGEDTSIPIQEEAIGAVIPRKNGGIVVAAGKTFYNLDEATGDLQAIAGSPSPQCDDCSLGDGRCDSKGRFWAGLLVGNFFTGLIPDGGSLLVLDNDVVTTKETGITQTNGLSWSPDEKTMYYTDSAKGVIYGYDFDVTTASLSNRRDVVYFDEETEGVPDGHTIDTDGNLWVAMNGGGGVVQVNPNTGEKLRKIDINDVSGVSACTFGGENLDELYVTTSSFVPSPFSEDGNVFKVTGLGVKGMPANFYDG